MSVLYPSSTRLFFCIQSTSSCTPECFRFHPWNSSPIEWWCTPDRRRLHWMLWWKPPAEWCSSPKFGSHVSLFPVPILGVNRNLHDLLSVLHQSDRWPAPVRPVDRAGQVGGCNNRTTNVPESLIDSSRPWNKNTPKTQPARKENPTQSLAKQLQTYQELTSSTTTQRHMSQAVHPRQIPQVAYTGQTGHTHRSDRSSLGSSGWTAPAGQLPQIQLPISRITPQIWTRLWG
jgi:hypothetical protein